MESAADQPANHSVRQSGRRRCKRRLVVDESGVDQCVTNGNHAYMGVPHSNMAFEFNTDCIDDHALFPSICFCDPWNNNIHYGKVTGSSC